MNPAAPERRGWHAIADGQQQREGELKERRDARNLARSQEQELIVGSLQRYVGLMAATDQTVSNVFVDRPAGSLLTSWPRKVSAYVVATPYGGGDDGPARPGIAVTVVGDVIVLRRPTKHDAAEGQYVADDAVAATVARAAGGVNRQSPAEKLDEMLVHSLRDCGVYF